MNKAMLQPGLQVVLCGNEAGVLYARVCTLGRRVPRNRQERWYFLPDAPAAPGVIVTRQPREIGPDEVVRACGLRAGRWPAQGWRLVDSQRGAVYAAHMQGRELPVLT